MKIDNVYTERKRFLQNGIIEIAPNDTKDEFTSNIFIRPKKDGSVQIILNFKASNNQYVAKSHFKMETLQLAIFATRKD